MKKFDYENANKKQVEAITTTDGPLLIIAGPGTGKTFTLVKRIAYLIVVKKVNPKNILAVTFTEKAAKELITRITNELNRYDMEIDVNDMYIGTFHQICLKILKEYREWTVLSKNYDMLDDFSNKYFIYRNINKFKMLDDLYDDKSKIPISNWKRSERILNIVSKIIEEIDEPERLLLDKDEKIATVGEIVSEYKDLLKKENALDFSNILSYCYELICKYKEVRDKLKERIKYIIVDEYQDTNKIQEKILFKLLDKNKNICVVGDDDQGLYRFRGATITNILRFTTNFDEGECKDIYLVDNYRSNQKIVDFYNEFMATPVEFEWGDSRFNNKKIKASKKDNDKRQTVVKCSSNTEIGWFEEVYKFISKLKKDNIINDYNQIAFLANSIQGDKVKGLIDYLEDNGISCYAPRSKQFFERIEIKLVIGSLLFCFPGYTDKITDEKYHMAESAKEYYVDCARIVKDMFSRNKKKYAPLINYFLTINKKFKTSDKLNIAFSDIVFDLFKYEPFASFIDMRNINNVHDERPIRNLARFTQMTSEFERIYHLDHFILKYLEMNLNQFFASYMWFLYEGGEGEYEDEKDISPSGCITFLTIHQSKGLEFPVVLVDSLANVPREKNDEVIDKIKKKYKKEKSIENEDYIKYYDFWRLYYTAFSRAENLLVLTCKEQVGRGATPSKYLYNAYNSVPDYKKVNLKGLKTESIKKSNIKDTYSFTSSIEIYNNCPKQYEFFHDYDFAEVKKGSKLYGSVVHETIEDIHKSYINGSGDKVDEHTISDFFEDNYKTLSKKLYAFLNEQQKASAYKEVINYFKNEKKNFKNIKEAEVDLSLVRDKYIMKGTVDLIRSNNETVEIVDFKSKFKPNMEKDKEILDIYKKQLEVYAYLVEKYHNVKVSKMHLYFTSQESGKPVITYEKNDKSIDNTIKEFDEVVDKIQNKNYKNRTHDLKTCSNCNMNAYCNLRKT